MSKKKYVNAKKILPKELIDEIQKYIEGEYVYIPTKNRKSWGSATGIKEELSERNNDIVQHYYNGFDIATLAEMYGLSQERIRSIIYTNDGDGKGED